MQVEDAHGIIGRYALSDTGRFYGSHIGLDLGVGLIYAGIRIPFYDDTEDTFLTLESVVLLLTHECDISPDNKRPFNDDVLVCPLLGLEMFIPLYEGRFGEAGLKSFLGAVAQRTVSRLMYFPPLAGSFPYGAMLYLNAICSTKLRAFHMPSAGVCGALSEFGLRELDAVLENHLLRPKDQPLSLWGSMEHYR